MHVRNLKLLKTCRLIFHFVSNLNVLLNPLFYEEKQSQVKRKSIQNLSKSQCWICLSKGEGRSYSGVQQSDYSPQAEDLEFGWNWLIVLTEYKTIWRQYLCQHDIEDEIIIWFRTFGILIWQWSCSLEFPTLLKQPPKTTLRRLSPQIDQIPGRGHLQQCRGQLWECGHYWHRGHLQICQPLWQLGRLHQLRQKQQQPFGRSQQFGQLQHQQWNRALNRSWPEEIQDNDVGDDDWHDQVDCVHCGGHCDGVRLCQGNIHSS